LLRVLETARIIRGRSAACGVRAIRPGKEGTFCRTARSLFFGTEPENSFDGASISPLFSGGGALPAQYAPIADARRRDRCRQFVRVPDGSAVPLVVPGDQCCRGSKRTFQHHRPTRLRRGSSL